MFTIASQPCKEQTSGPQPDASPPIWPSCRNTAPITRITAKTTTVMYNLVPHAQGGEVSCCDAGIARRNH